VVVDDNSSSTRKASRTRASASRAASSSAGTRSCRARTATSIWPRARTSASMRFSRAACGLAGRLSRPTVTHRRRSRLLRSGGSVLSQPRTPRAWTSATAPGLARARRFSTA
jgi:hypothetical protein